MCFAWAVVTQWTFCYNRFWGNVFVVPGNTYATVYCYNITMEVPTPDTLQYIYLNPSSLDQFILLLCNYFKIILVLYKEYNLCLYFSVLVYFLLLLLLLSLSCEQYPQYTVLKQCPSLFFLQKKKSVIQWCIANCLHFRHEWNVVCCTTSLEYTYFSSVFFLILSILISLDVCL
jgi:hypothetical protein